MFGITLLIKMNSLPISQSIINSPWESAHSYYHQSYTNHHLAKGTLPAINPDMLSLRAFSSRIALTQYSNQRLCPVTVQILYTYFSATYANETGTGFSFRFNKYNTHKLALKITTWLSLHTSINRTIAFITELKNNHLLKD